jgi:flavin reductase (DIM6/NTAB) family NADH-FMN oxidoreductase RutF
MLSQQGLRVPAEIAGACVDAATFRSIMSAFPSGVTVVATLDAAGRPVGVTCSATCSVSLDPPLLLVCLHRHSRVLGALLDRGQFIVNFLRGNREGTSSLFASSAENRFASVVWQPSPRGGLPLLPVDTIAHAECEVASAIDAGDHVIVIGAIVDGHAHDDTFGPLMYWRRRYGRWPAEEDTMTIALTLAAEG